MSGQRLAYGYLSESSGQLIRSNQRDEHTSGFNPTGPMPARSRKS